MAKLEPASRTINVRIICVAPPADDSDGVATKFGLQDSKQALFLGQEQEDGSRRYEIAMPVKLDSSGGLRFGGPYAQGTPPAPFLYLSLGRLDAAPGEWIKRLKIPLPDLTRAQLDAIPPTSAIVARVSGSGSGTVPLLDGGWVVE